MTKMDECDLAEEAKWDLKRKICSTFVISMDRILECVNYKRPDTQPGWCNNFTEENVLKFLTSVSYFVVLKMKFYTDYHIVLPSGGGYSVLFVEKSV